MGKTVMIWLVVSIVVSVVHGQMSDTACQGPLPCYDVVIHQVAGGKSTLNDVIKEQDFLEAPSRAGMMRNEILAEGHKAAVFFKDTFGVDFSSMPDDAFLTGKRMNADGVEFRPFIVSEHYSLYMASTGAGSQFFNIPIFRQGWLLNFTRPISGRGSFEKPIPNGAVAEFGHYFYHPCGMPQMNNFAQPCKNILNPEDPHAPLFISYRFPTYFQTVSEPYTYIPLNFIVEHPVWGEGRARGVITFRDSEENIDISLTLYFPSYK